MNKNNDYMIDVSIVIVCMNNLKNLYPCLESIRRYTSVSYECFVVAYLFSSDNLVKVKKDFPWVKFIESNEIRGFSENNNLALRQAKGKYCFVVNDDTEMRTAVVDKLVETMESLPDNAAIVSPVTTFPDGRVQVCGRAYRDWKTFVAYNFHIKNWYEKEQTNKEGIFKSYNILGAAFLIKTEFFKQVGWFDEQYFFCPEDIALSDTLNKKGYSCYVNNNVRIIHYEGMSGKSMSLIQTATMPAAVKGSLIFYSHKNRYLYFFLSVLIFVLTSLKMVIHLMKGLLRKKPNYDYILSIGERHVLCSLFCSNTPKEVFVKYYKKLNIDSTKK